MFPLSRHWNAAIERPHSSAGLGGDSSMAFAVTEMCREMRMNRGSIAVGNCCGARGLRIEQTETTSAVLIQELERKQNQNQKPNFCRPLHESTSCVH